MFCYQCEQTAKGTGCTVKGVCGKDERVAALQDLLIYATEGIAQYAHAARELGASDRDVDLYIIQALFTTVTNVNFDADNIAEIICAAGAVREHAKNMYEDAALEAGQKAEQLTGPAQFALAGDIEGLVAEGHAESISKRINSQGEDVTGLQELIMYGL